MNEEEEVQAKKEKPETNETKIDDTILTKADPVKRIIAFIIDAVASIIVGFIPFVGELLAPFICSSEMLYLSKLLSIKVLGRNC